MCNNNVFGVLLIMVYKQPLPCAIINVFGVLLIMVYKQPLPCAIIVYLVFY